MHKSIPTHDILKDLISRKWEWIWNNHNYPIFFIIFLGVSSIGFWGEEDFNSKNILIYCLPLISEMILIGALMGIHSLSNKEGKGDNGFKSIFVIMFAIVAIWILLWFFVYHYKLFNTYSWQAGAALSIVLLWSFFFKSENAIFQDITNPKSYCQIWCLGFHQAAF